MGCFDCISCPDVMVFLGRGELRGLADEWPTTPVDEARGIL